MSEVSSASGVPTSSGTLSDADPRLALIEARMSMSQKVGVGTTLLITATDGFDILAAAFAAPSIMVEWNIPHATIGLILAANLIGLGLGALLISPLADRVGRRLTIIPCLLLVAASMFLAAFARNASELAMLRLVAGLGIGGMVGATLSLATEYANRRNQPLTAAVMSIGLPLGGLAGGIAAAWLLTDYDWRAIFIAGGAITLAVTAIATALLPESVDFLINTRDERRLGALNDVLRRFGQPTLSKLPSVVEPVPSNPAHAQGRRRSRIFCPDLRATTIAMTIINFAMMMTIFYFVSWLPQLVADMKFTGAQAAGVSIYQNLFGIVGAMTVGVLARHLPIVPLVTAAMIGTAVTIIVFSLMPADLTLLKVAAAAEGFMALGCSAGIYALMARSFPAAARSTGIGFAYAFGRLGSIIAAAVPGVLFTSGWSSPGVATLMAFGTAVAVVTVLLWTARNRISAAPETETGAPGGTPSLQP